MSTPTLSPPGEISTSANGAAAAGSAAAAAPRAVQVITPPRAWEGLDWPELWRYRELFFFLAWRDVKLRYKQTVLGAAWALLQPALQMVMFTVLFGSLAGIGSRTAVPYPLFVYAGLVPWTFFANAVTVSSLSLVSSANLVTKVYFPRLLVPLAAIAAGSVDLGVALGLLVALLAWYGVAPGAGLAALPLALAGLLLLAGGVGSYLAAVSVAYRDVRYVVPFLVQLWMFASGVIYPVEMVPDRWRIWFDLNPVAGLLAAFRGSVIGGPVDWRQLAISVGASAVLFALGIGYFRRVEHRFSDVV